MEHTDDYYHEKLRLLRDAYISIKLGDSNTWNYSSSAVFTHTRLLYQQTSPIGNTVLHIAAMYENDVWVEKIAREAPHLLSQQNVYGETALHVAAKAGHISTVKKLLVAHYTTIRTIYNYHDQLFIPNNQGNTFFHEAISGRHQGLLNLLVDHQGELNFLEDIFEYYTLLRTNKEDKSGLYLMIEAGCFNQLVDLVMTKLRPNALPQGRSPLHAAILKRHQGILEMILTRKPEWIHLRYEEDGRMGIHYAASVGYLDGVNCLLRECSAQASVRDKYGFFPIHLAAYEGHVEVVHKLLELEHCPYPREMVDNSGRNILHLAIEGGELKMVKYILQQSTINHELEKMINHKDFNGNTPLHVATLRCHPKIVYELTCHKRVDLTLTNDEGQTALDVCMPHVWRSFGKLSPRRMITRSVLVSAGVKESHIEVPTRPQNTKNSWQEEAPKTDQYKERTNTLILVATLIVTVTFAAGFTLPGGINTDSTKEKGMALMLHNILFKLFMIFNTASMYGAIGVIILLIWAQLEDLTLFLYSFSLAIPLLGFTLATLSLAFFTGVELVISHLTWLAAFIGVMSSMFMLLSLFIYAPFLIPMATRTPVLKYISHCSMLLQMWLFVDNDEAISSAFTGQSKPVVETSSRGDAQGQGSERMRERKVVLGQEKLMLSGAPQQGGESTCIGL